MASGSSQSTYCWDHTLPTTRNTATTRNASWANRGRRGAATVSTAIPIQASTNIARYSVFRRPCSGSWLSVWNQENPYRPAPSGKCSPMYQSVPQSIPLVRFRCQNSSHECGYPNQTGTLSASQLAIPAPTVVIVARQRPDRSASRSSGPARNSG